MSLRTEVDASIAAADWLTAADDAAVQLARSYADSIDEVLAEGTASEKTKALYLGPHLLATLREMGCTPAGRLVTKSKPGGGHGRRDEDGEGRQAALESIAGGKRPQRPPKRA